MTLPTPRLDDRSFQDLVDEAKQYIRMRCPEWSDHNVSDPGVTLIEAFAWMTDMLLYRVNQVPDLNFVKFLELIGVKLLPPAAAVVAVDFRLASPPVGDLVIPRGSVVSTERSTTELPIPFTTTGDLTVVSAVLSCVASMVEPDSLRDHTNRNGSGDVIVPFDDPPKPDDALYLGLDRAAPSNTLLVQVDAEVAGAGIRPKDPPLRWDAWVGDDWEQCAVTTDTTGGLNKVGEIVVHLPAGHTTSIIGGRAHGWVRCRVIPVDEHAFTRSPRLREINAVTIGGTADAVNAVEIEDEVLGVSDGVAAQEFVVQRAPVVGGDETAIEVSRATRDRDDEEILIWEPWEVRPTFADSGPDDRHVTIDPTAGVVRFGPCVRQPDGALRYFGGVPPKGATVRVRRYKVGGGNGGNVAAGSIRVLRSSIPSVAEVTNRRPALGGVDGETLDQAKLRGPIALRTRNRAVTTEDFEFLTRETASEIGRVKCVEDADQPAAVRVLIVPAVTDLPVQGGEALELLLPHADVVRRVKAYLDDRRLVGTRVNVEPPSYVTLRVVAELRARSDADPVRVEEEALRRLHGFLHPITGGPEGRGWPFGRPLHIGDLYSTLHQVAGVEIVEKVDMYRINLKEGTVTAAGDRVDLQPTFLILSHDHRVAVAS